MSNEFVNWFQDIGRYITELRKRSEMRQTGKGVDYTSEEYSQSVKKVVSRLHPKTMKLKVKGVIQETPTTKTLRFERTDGPFPPFRPGQYINLFLTIDGVVTSRAYSMSSAPDPNVLDLTIRVKPGGFVSQYLVDNAKIGDEFESTGPAGQFYYEPLIDRGELVFIGGGSGITPFASIIRDHAKKDWPIKIHLLYGSRTLDDVIFGGEFDELSKDNPNLNYALVLSDEKSESYKGVRGFITADLIKTHVGDIEDKTFMICGPNALYDFCLKELEKLGVPQHKIRRELYGPPDPVTAEPGWPKKIKATDEFKVEIEGQTTITAKAGEPLLNSLERHGIKTPPPLCRSGECSYCRTKLLSGKVFMPSHVGLRESDRKHGYIHACVSYPLEDLKIGF